MTPRLLDWAINGVPVYIYRRASGGVYATKHDFSRFGVNAIATVRVKITEKTPAGYDVETDPAVLKKLAKL